MTALDFNVDDRPSVVDPTLMTALAAAARAAAQALESSRPDGQALLRVLDGYAAKVQASRVEVPHGSNEQIREIVSAFTVKYDALRAKLDRLLGSVAGELAAAFADLDRDAAFVTLMLFGRTRAGKSTTMEALTAGDGASIGVGRQHTTTEIRTYYYPRQHGGAEPDLPALRIVDTPGIEGFEGDALAAMAERFIERSDHILFLLTDDKATADELERFGTIRTQGKGVTVLLNVKAKDEDLDLLVENPELIFRQKEIDEHTRRISGYLEKHFEMPPPRVIPMHARAAWLANSYTTLPKNVRNQDRELLRQHSRLGELERRIEDFVRQEARLARLRTPRDLLLGYLMPLKDELRPLAGDFRQMMASMDQVSRRLRDGTEQARARIARRFPLLRARFQAASDAIPGMIDALIAAGGRGTALDAKWQDLLRQHGVTDAVPWFVTAGQQDFREQIEAEVQAASFDFAFSKADGLDERLGQYYEAEDDEKKYKYARAGIRAVAGVGASLLAGWAITNWWNPSGAVALAASAVAGYAAEEVARTATEEWERASRRDMYEKREFITAKLRDHLWADYRAVRRRCDEWLDHAKDMQKQTIEDIARPVSNAARQLWQATVHSLDRLDEIADHVSEALVRALFAAVVHECDSGTVSITAVTREPGRRTKVVVSSALGNVNAVGACVGRQGSRIRRIAEALGDRKIDLVDAKGDMATQVVQALGLRPGDFSSVVIDEREGTKAVQIHAASPSVARAAVGPRGINVRLAKKLLGIDIVIKEN